VNYEVAYYLMYGCFFYVAGARRWLLLAAVCLFFGPRVLYLAPLWIAGCLLHDLYQRWNARGVTASRLTGFSVLMALVWWGLTGLSRSQSEVFQRMPLSKMIAVMNNVGVRPDDYIFGFAWMAIFLWLLFLARQVTLRADTTGVRVTQFIAEGTFPIYLLHFPIFVAIAACVPYNHAALAPNLAIFFGVLVLGVLAGHPGNLLKLRIRKLLSAR
jgi:peptidoglycan/LPS O-acetylase OafA/YrhL